MEIVQSKQRIDVKNQTILRPVSLRVAQELDFKVNLEVLCILSENT